MTTTILVAADAAGARLDVFLAASVPHLSRRTAQRLIAAGRVRVDGRRAGKAQPVAPGAVVEVDAADEGTLAWAQPCEAPLPVVYSDASVLAIEKAAGIPTLALAGSDRITVADFLAARFPECLAAGPDPREAGAVHRLDNDTSGLLLVARTPSAYAFLRGEFARGAVVKEYLALVHGAVREEQSIRLPIAHDRRRPRRMRIVSPVAAAGRPALTEIRPIESGRKFSLVAARMRTGVRHQVRVHLAAIGHPIVGDSLYAKESAAASVPAPTRHLLHACYVEFLHPELGVRMELRSGLPSDFRAALGRLRARPRPQR